MDEKEKLIRVLLGALFAVGNGIHLGFTAQESLDMIALLTDTIARKMDIELTESQIIRLKEECAMLIVQEIIGEVVCEKS